MTNDSPPPSSPNKGILEEFEETVSEFASKQLPNDENGRTNFIVFETSLYSDSFGKCNLLDRTGGNEDYSFRNLKSPESDSEFQTSNMVLPANDNTSHWLEEFRNHCQNQREILEAQAISKQADLRKSLNHNLVESRILEDYVEKVKSQSIESVNSLAEPLLLKRERQTRRWEHMYCRIRELMST